MLTQKVLKTDKFDESELWKIVCIGFFKYFFLIDEGKSAMWTNIWGFITFFLNRRHKDNLANVQNEKKHN